MDTHLNWGASYLVHDFYRRFIKADAHERHYVLVGRLVTAGLMVVGASMVYILETAKDSFDIMLSIGAGTGLIYLLRWFWWRVNAWSEISAMISSFLIALVVFVSNKWVLPGSEAAREWLGQRGLLEAESGELLTHWTLVTNVALTTVVWIAVTLVTPPTNERTLLRFYKLVRPFGPGWRRIRDKSGVGPSPDSLPHALLGWALGCMLVYSGLFGTGQLLYGQIGPAVACAVPFTASAAGLLWVIPRFLRPSRDCDSGGVQK
jgi:hypothetical protein